jgi:hypothetical protein
MQELEQKLKLSTSNIIALAAVLLSMIGGYINLTSSISKIDQRVTYLEKADEDKKAGFAKFDFKLDKISESINQLKVDMAGQRIKDAEKTN